MIYIAAYTREHASLYAKSCNIPLKDWRYVNEVSDLAGLSGKLIFLHSWRSDISPRFCRIRQDIRDWGTRNFEVIDVEF